MTLRRIVTILASVALTAACLSSAFATNADICAPSRAGYADALACYQQTVESQPLRYESTETALIDGVEQRNYLLTSQSWSSEWRVEPAEWRHDVAIYIPQDALQRRALVIATNGTRYPNNGADPIAPNEFTPEVLAGIASRTRTVVVALGDIPNQYLTYIDGGVSRREDDSVAHTWSLFMASPSDRKTLPLQVPMAASISRAMTLAERELAPLDIRRFIVSGTSKRAWAAWLSVVADPRVDAVAPFVIDILGVGHAMKNMYRSYGGNWPIAMAPYVAEDIDNRVDTPEFSLLAQIIDPLSYLDTPYRRRLSVPKYIVNASGDDFFVPDNANLYIDRLPGQKALRMVPNASHGGIRSSVAGSLVTFINRIQAEKPLPEVREKLRRRRARSELSFRSSEAPEKLLLWSATNEDARDFRYACGIRYASTPVESSGKRMIHVPLDEPTTGWRAYFLEATYSDGFVATSRTHILGNPEYPAELPPSDGLACQTLPGRGFLPTP